MVRMRKLLGGESDVDRGNTACQLAFECLGLQVLFAAVADDLAITLHKT